MNDNTALTLVLMSMCAMVGIGLISLSEIESDKYASCVAHHSPAECK